MLGHFIRDSRCVARDCATIADGIAATDVVTMHRVIRCYPNYVALLQRATDLTRTHSVYCSAGLSMHSGRSRDPFEIVAG
jgi:hypothetical protein